MTHGSPYENRCNPETIGLEEPVGDNERLGSAESGDGANEGFLKTVLEPRDQAMLHRFCCFLGSGLEFRPSVGKLSGIRHTEADVGTGTTSGDCESGRPTAIRTVRFQGRGN